MTEVIQELSLSNFEGYREETVRFTAGLNIIRGRNSTGKSTILDGITYALFGEVPGIKAGTLVSKFPGISGMKTIIRFNGTKPQVQVSRAGSLGQRGEFRTDDRKLLVAGKEERVDSEDDLRAKVAELLGVSLRRFHSLVYVRQGEMTEILNPDREQTDSMLQITLLRELREQFEEVGRYYGKYEGADVTTQLNAMEPLIRDRRAELKGIDGDVKLLEGEVAELSELVKRSESKELLQLTDLISRRDDLNRETRDLSVTRVEVLREAKVGNEKELSSLIDSTKGEFEEWKAKRDALAEAVERERRAWSNAEGLATAQQAEVDNHASMAKSGVTRCANCGQEISKDRLRVVILEGKAKLQSLREAESVAFSKYDSDKKRLELLNDAAGYEHEIDQLTERKRRLEERARHGRSIASELAEVSKGITGLLSSLSLHFDAVDEDLKVKVAQKLSIGAEELAEKKERLVVKQGQLNEKKKRRSEVAGWIESSERQLTLLKGRLEKASLAKSFAAQFDQAVESRRTGLLAAIEYKALEYYKQLTDQLVYNKFVIDPETYAVSVHRTGLTQPIPATRVGGGHQTLIALSVRLALMDITHCKSLLMLDEPTYGVDDENMPQLASYLGALPNYVNQVLIVTHFDICEESASNVIEVALEAGGSRIMQ